MRTFGIDGLCLLIMLLISGVGVAQNTFQILGTADGWDAVSAIFPEHHQRSCILADNATDFAFRYDVWTDTKKKSLAMITPYEGDLPDDSVGVLSIGTQSWDGKLFQIGPIIMQSIPPNQSLALFKAIGDKGGMVVASYSQNGNSKSIDFIGASKLFHLFGQCKIQADHADDD